MTWYIVQGFFLLFYFVQTWFPDSIRAIELRKNFKTASTYVLLEEVS